MELACLTGLYQLDGVLEGHKPIKFVLKGFTDKRAGRCMVPSLTSMDLYEQITAWVMHRIRTPLAPCR
jgi:hypothetical protein